MRFHHRNKYRFKIKTHHTKKPQPTTQYFLIQWRTSLYFFASNLFSILDYIEIINCPTIRACFFPNHKPTHNRMHCSCITAILNSQDRTISVIDDLPKIIDWWTPRLEEEFLLQLTRQDRGCGGLLRRGWAPGVACVVAFDAWWGLWGVSIAPPPCCEVSPWRPRHCCGGPQPNAADATDAQTWHTTNDILVRACTGPYINSWMINKYPQGLFQVLNLVLEWWHIKAESYFYFIYIYINRVKVYIKLFLLLDADFYLENTIHQT